MCQTRLQTNKRRVEKSGGRLFLMLLLLQRLWVMMWKSENTMSFGNLLIWKLIELLVFYEMMNCENENSCTQWFPTFFHAAQISKPIAISTEVSHRQTVENEEKEPENLCLGKNEINFINNKFYTVKNSFKTWLENVGENCIAASWWCMWPFRERNRPL